MYIKFDYYDIKHIDELEEGDVYEFSYNRCCMYCKRLAEWDKRGSNFQYNNKYFFVNFFAPDDYEISYDLEA